jgi:aryl-alcohol dehydrogenase-like predicted oxidoreductase
LGRGGPRVSRIGLGLAAIGRPAYITTHRAADFGSDRSEHAFRARTWDVVDAAYSVGVRYVDVARSYGLAEAFLSEWLAQHADATDLVIGSKWGYTYVGAWDPAAPVQEVKDLSVATFERQYGETRALLGDRLHLYQVHIDGVPLFSSVQATWNLLEPSAGPALAEAADAGWAVIVKEAVANGRLTAAGDAGRVGSVLGAVAAASGNDPDALAMAAVLAQPWVSLVLSGAATVDQLASNLRALEIATPDIPELAEPAEDYWAVRSARPWR